MSKLQFGKESPYAEDAMRLLEELEAEGVIVLVFNGKKGHGAAGQFTSVRSLTHHKVTTIMRKMAQDIEANPGAYISSVTIVNQKPH